MNNVCSDYSIMPILVLVKNFLTLFQIIVPIILLIITTVRLLKCVKNPDDKKEKQKVKNAFLAAAITFFIPMAVNIVFQLIGSNTTLSDCWNNAKFELSTKYININSKKKNPINNNPDDYEKGVPKNGGICLDKTKSTKVLFVGNSKTYVHDIPSKFQHIAESEGYKVSVSSVTQGGKTLSYLASNYKSQITSSAYDCVIMQEQTDAYASGGSTYSNGISAVANLVKSKNPNVKTYVRALWILDSSSASELNKAYAATEKYAESTSSGVIYDGKAFENSRKKYPNINLYGDERHQSEAGAYLSALVIYNTISGTNTKTTYYASLNKDTATKLQIIAAN